MNNTVNVAPLPPHIDVEELDRRVLAEIWPEPDDIEFPPLPEFPVNALPRVLRKWVSEESEATQTPPDMAALLALAVCAASLAKRVEIQAWDGWCEPCNLYVAAILDPANRKSAVFADATRPLCEFERALQESSAEDVAVRESEYRQLQKRLAKLEKTAAEHRDENIREAASREARSAAEKLAVLSPPQLPTLIVDDATSEKLAILLEANGERMACMSAEGGVFDLMAGKYSKSGLTDLNVHLKGHSGDSLSVQRVSRPAVNLQAPALTMAFAIQPEVIRGIAGNPAFRGRGLLGRFLYAMPKSWIGHRKIGTRPVSPSVSRSYANLVTSLAGLQPKSDNRPQKLLLSTKARTEFKELCEWIESELGSGTLEMMRDWGGKLAGTTLRVAGLLHYAGHGIEAAPNRKITARTIGRAQRIAKWAIPHAAAAFDLLEASSQQSRVDAIFLLRWLRSRGAVSTFTRREANRRGHRRFTNQQDRLDAALQLLESTSHIAKSGGSNVGGTSTYAISPYVIRGASRPEASKGGDNGAKQAIAPPSEPLLSPLSPDSIESDQKTVGEKTQPR